MARFGAMYPCFAPFADTEKDTEMPKYKDGVVLGELVQANLTVTLASGDIWGDNRQIENVNEFASGSIPMETVDMTDEVAEVVYGVTPVNDEIHYKPGDAPPYGGLAYIVNLQRGGEKYYRGIFYPKVQAAIGNENAQTKGSSISFQTTTTNFTIMAPLFSEGAWKIDSTTFEKETEAKDWCKQKLNMTA